MINDSGFVDFPSRGNTLSWRGRRRGKIVRFRLDRALATEEWHDLFPVSHVEYLPMIGSDHRPILATLDSKITKSLVPGLVDRIYNCRHEILVWRKNNQPYERQKIAELQQALEEIQEDDNSTQEELIDITNKLKEAYKDEEEYWKQKVDFTGVLEHMSHQVTAQENAVLTRCATKSEVREALFMMHPEKAPGPDSMTALFFQRSWHIIKNDILELVNSFLTMGTFDERLNMTHICLIPKTGRPSRMTELRPISLCNVGYKIISKVLCQRLKVILPRLITETQSTFVPDRLISDNILIAQEMFHDLRTNKSCKVKYMAVKTDMNNAYDRVEWMFMRL
ncbi:unnamed protein product [Microthlaspi erraticum]|uniref:Reverse transcriptase domain-containing protein n=1 Tax=Microthlaspi erraticum TaxID=1685480 RepID=A0A6D2KG23_9BRAS|nr:unnamed protein product [Microthlaspi erraticum]